MDNIRRTRYAPVFTRVFALIAVCAAVYVSAEFLGIGPLLSPAVVIGTLLGLALLSMFHRQRLTASRESEALRENQRLLKLLGETQERHRTLVDNVLSPVIIAQAGRIKFANRFFYSLSGYSPEEVASEDFDIFSLIYEEDRTSALENVATLLEGGRIPDPREMRFVKKSGETVSALVFSSLIQFDGEPAIETIAVDVSGIKRMERELSATKERLQYLLDNAPVMIFSLDSEGNFSYVNEETVRVTGYRAEDWINRPFAPIVHPDDLPLALAKFEEGRRGGPKRDYTLRIYHADGSPRILHIAAGSIWRDDQFEGSLIIARDITQQQRLEKQLETDKRFIDQLIENANALIAAVDEDGKLVIFNRLFEELTGFTKEEALGSDSLQLLVSEEYRQAVSEKVGKVRGDKPLLEFEVPIVSEAGKSITVRLNAAAVELPSGGRAIVMVGQDVTQQKRMHEELVQSKKLASVGELVSGVAHELNNPLTAVMGYSQLLTANQDLSEKQREMCAKILESAARSKRIVENLLAFARKRKLQKQQVDINEILENTLALREHNLMVNNIKIVRRYDEALPPTYGDAHQLQQVFLNLINNAFDSMYSTHHGGTLRVTTLRRGGRIVVEVTDDGAGIPASAQDKVFDPFFTTKEVGKGTGLGMSLSYGIVREHGGEIYLDKTFREGARFIVELPLLPVSAPVAR